MEKEEIVEILKDAGWEETWGIPEGEDVVDYQHWRLHRRILLYPEIYKRVTREDLDHLMNGGRLEDLPRWK